MPAARCGFTAGCAGGTHAVPRRSGGGRPALGMPAEIRARHFYGQMLILSPWRLIWCDLCGQSAKIRLPLPRINLNRNERLQQRTRRWFSTVSHATSASARRPPNVSNVAPVPGVMPMTPRANMPHGVLRTIPTSRKTTDPSTSARAVRPAVPDVRRPPSGPYRGRPDGPRSDRSGGYGGERSAAEDRPRPYGKKPFGAPKYGDKPAYGRKSAGKFGFKRPYGEQEGDFRHGERAGAPKRYGPKSAGGFKRDDRRGEVRPKSYPRYNPNVRREKPA